MEVRDLLLRSVRNGSYLRFLPELKSFFVTCMVISSVRDDKTNKDKMRHMRFLAHFKER